MNKLSCKKCTKCGFINTSSNEKCEKCSNDLSEVEIKYFEKYEKQVYLSVFVNFIAKNRNGQTGTGVLLFLKSYQSFGNPTDEFIEDYKLKKKNAGAE